MLAQFDPAYDNWVKPSEGFYGWISGDSGGETYAGIARNYNPSWAGWTAIDFLKKSKYGGKPLPQNFKVDGVDGMVRDFYKALWNKNLLGQLNNQDVANIYFDMIVNAGGNGVKLMQKILGVTQDGAMGPGTLAAINKYPDQNRLHDLYKDARVSYYNSIAAKNPDLKKFLNGWLNRINSFPNLSTSLKIGGGIVIVLLLVACVVLLTI